MTSQKYPTTIAVFDVDETLVPFKSMFSFLEFAMKDMMGLEVGKQNYDLFCAEIGQYRRSLPRETVNRLFYKVFKGWDFTDLETLVEQWWDQIPPSNRWIPEVVAILKTHQEAGHHILLLSGSAEFILKPISRSLAADSSLAIKLGRMPGGECDGEICGIQTIGRGKQEALVQFECLAEIDAKIIGYGDHESDLAFLRYCDEAHIVVQQSADEPVWSKGIGIINVRDFAAREARVPQVNGNQEHALLETGFRRFVRNVGGTVQSSG